MSINAPAIDDKRLATLQAAAALRGITVSAMQDGSYMVGHGVYLREVADIEALAALLARMGVRERRAEEAPMNPRMARVFAKLGDAMAGRDRDGVIHAQNEIADMRAEQLDFVRGACE